MRFSARNVCEMSKEEISQKLNSNLKKGLNEQSVISRRKEYGENNFVKADEETLLSKFMGQFSDPMIIMLLVSGGVSLLMGQISDGLSIGLAVVIVCFVAFIQEYRSDQAISKLKTLITHECSVIRGGEKKKIDSTHLVIGDIVEISQGDRIPADMRITEIHGNDFFVNESLFTGETEPVQKSTNKIILEEHFEHFPLHSHDDDIPKEQADLADSIPHYQNSCFTGTFCTQGKARGIVFSIGENTCLGKISAYLAKMKEVKTPLEKTMSLLAQQISYISFGIIGVIFLVGVITGKNWLDMVQMSISLAVAAIPEGLPIVVTVTLGMGVLRMSKKNTIVRKLQSVESLGAVNVICVDKTGTLTKNELTVKYVYTHANHKDFYYVSGTGFNSNGSVFKNKLSKFNDPVESYVNLQIDKDDILDSLIKCGNICNHSKVYDDSKIIGLPTEAALLYLTKKRGIIDQRSIYSEIQNQSIQFTSKNKWMGVTTFSKSDESDSISPSLTSNSYSEKEKTFYIKGGLEVILKKCNSYLSKSGRLEKLTPEDRKQILEVAKQFSLKKLRVLGFAQKKFSSDDDENFSDIRDKPQFAFLGCVGMYDPPRPGVKKSIKTLKDSGVRIVMITGDSKDTAIAIAKELGIITSAYSENLAVGGHELNNKQELQKQIENTCVFYRVCPIHKQRIVNALQKKSKIVAMTGDGINDSIALKGSDIGIAMGRNGSDIAKESSDMVLLDDDFTTILRAIEEGKGIFNNIKNFLRYQLTTSLTAMGLIIFSTLLGFPLPLNPMQILYVNLIMDGMPAQSLGLEPTHPEVLNAPPRNIKDSPIDIKMIINIIVNSIIMLFGSLFIFLKEFYFDNLVTARDTSMVFATFVLFQIFNAFNCRSATQSIFKIGLWANRPLLAATGGTFIGLVLLIYVPFLQHIFDTVPLGLTDWFIIIPISSSILIIEEIVKYLIAKKNKN